MSAYMGSITEAGILLSDLAERLSTWSQATFGTDQERGPVGPLKHLAKEAQEAWEAWQCHTNKDQAKTELADCLILVLDASRRAGVKPMQLMELAMEKVKLNEKRTWPKPVADEPVEHVRDTDPTTSPRRTTCARRRRA